jgi:hypothetical protein
MNNILRKNKYHTHTLFSKMKSLRLETFFDEISRTIVKHHDHVRHFNIHCIDIKASCIFRVLINTMNKVLRRL